MRAYEPKILPGLLQTEEYMREMFTALEYPEKVEQLVQIRMKRKELLKNARGFILRTIIDTPALHRIEGDSELVRNQLRHLLAVGKQANVNIQVMPLDASLPMLQYGPYTVFGLRGEPPVDLVWLEHITGGTLLEQRRDVQAYSKAWDELTAAALSPSASQQYIRDLIEESGP